MKYRIVLINEVLTFYILNNHASRHVAENCFLRVYSLESVQDISLIFNGKHKNAFLLAYKFLRVNSRLNFGRLCKLLKSNFKNNT